MQAGGHSTPGFPAALTGLSAEDVAERVRNNQTNDIGLTHTRTTGDILRANILTPFNALLGGLLAVILVVGQIQDALFGLVLVANALVGIIQELRAKRSLDRLALLSAPKASILREGQLVQHSIENVVIDDVLELQPGDQVVVDGAVVTSSELEIDESLLTGESDPVAKRGGDEVLSGSFVAAGSGFYRATRVGAKAYARALADEARRFTLSRSELRVGINRVIKLIGWAMLPTAGLLFYSQTQALTGTAAALRGTVAGVVAMVPEGLVLLTSVAFALGVIRLGRQNALVQELPAVETLARVDVICLDKTGTITHGDLSVTGFHTLTGDGDGEDRAALAALASADTSPNSTLLAVRASFPAQDGWKVSDSVAFSSARKWSGATFEARGSWVLGAPDVLLSRSKPAVENEALLRQVDQETASGNRVLLLATSPEILKSDLIPAIVPRALIVLSDRVREEAHDTLRYFHEQGVQVKIISGDHPRTVAIVAGRAGVHGADKAMDARNLTGDEGEMTAALDHHAVFGRVTPQQKRLMIRALQHSGHVVAMTGDGVNDVLALKDADIGIAMGSGASASRAVAKLLLLDGSFAVLPKVVDEGRRVINNVERVANLFLTKTVYSMLLALGTGLLALPFPFLPRHLTLVGSLTIGIPGFFLALAPNHELAHSGFVKRILRFAIPAGVLGAAATFLAYYESRDIAQVSLAESKSAATIALAVYGLLALCYISKSLKAWRLPLVGAMTAGLVLSITVAPLSVFFKLDPPPLSLFALTLGSVTVAFALAIILTRALNR